MPTSRIGRKKINFLFEQIVQSFATWCQAIFYEVNDRFVDLNRWPRFRVEVNDPSFTWIEVNDSDKRQNRSRWLDHWPDCWPSGFESFFIDLEIVLYRPRRWPDCLPDHWTRSLTLNCFSLTLNHVHNILVNFDDYRKSKKSLPYWIIPHLWIWLFYPLPPITNVGEGIPKIFWNFGNFLQIGVNFTVTNRRCMLEIWNEHPGGKQTDLQTDESWICLDFL